LVGYPIAKLYGNDSKEINKKNTFIKIVSDPFIFVYLISIVVGITLNTSGLVRPTIYKSMNGILIPLLSILLVISVGYNMKIKAVSMYVKECLSIAAIKFIIIPIIITTAASIIGIGTMQDGLILKVILVLSAMPPAFNSLIPPQIYNLDADLANSSWLFCTGSLIIVVPVLYFIIGLI
jgi:predicted permease